MQVARWVQSAVLVGSLSLTACGNDKRHSRTVVFNPAERVGTSDETFARCSASRSVGWSQGAPASSTCLLSDAPSAAFAEAPVLRVVIDSPTIAGLSFHLVNRDRTVAIAGDSLEQQANGQHQVTVSELAGIL